MKHSHGHHTMKGMKQVSHKGRVMSQHIIKGSMASASVQTGSKLMSKLTKHPVLIFGLGVAAGYVAYKYRKQIVSSVGKATDAGKDFVLQQKENLEDIVSETKEESL